MALYPKLLALLVGGLQMVRQPGKVRTFRKSFAEVFAVGSEPSVAESKPVLVKGQADHGRLLEERAVGGELNVLLVLGDDLVEIADVLDNLEVDIVHTSQTKLKIYQGRSGSTLFG